MPSNRLTFRQFNVVLQLLAMYRLLVSHLSSVASACFSIFKCSRIVLYRSNELCTCTCVCIFCLILQIRGALGSLEGLQQPVDVRVIRDHVTSASRGFCFLEFSTGEVVPPFPVLHHIHVRNCGCAPYCVCRWHQWHCERCWNKHLPSLSMEREVSSVLSRSPMEIHYPFCSHCDVCSRQQPQTTGNSQSGISSHCPGPVVYGKGCYVRIQQV